MSGEDRVANLQRALEIVVLTAVRALHRVSSGQAVDQVLIHVALVTVNIYHNEPRISRAYANVGVRVLRPPPFDLCFVGCGGPETSVADWGFAVGLTGKYRDAGSRVFERSLQHIWCCRRCAIRSAKAGSFEMYSCDTISIVLPSWDGGYVLCRA